MQIEDDIVEDKSLQLLVQEIILSIMPPIKEEIAESTAHSLSPLSAPEYLAVHAEVKKMIPWGCWGQNPPINSPLRHSGMPCHSNLDCWV